MFAQLEAEMHRRGYVARVCETYEAMGDRAHADIKKNHAQMKMQQYERSYGADPKHAATLVGVDPMMASNFWFPKSDDKII